MSFTLFKSSAFGADRRVLGDGSGFALPQVVSFVAQDHYTVRVTFSHAMLFGVQEGNVTDPNSYTITRQVDGEQLLILRCLKVSATEVDLVTTGQEVGIYDAAVSLAVLDIWGNGMDPAANSVVFTGIGGVAPTATWLTSLMGLDSGMQEQLHAGFIPDLVAPALQNQDPAPFETLVDQDKVVEFEIIDTESGVDVNEVKIWIEGVLAWENDAPQTGFSGVRTPIVDGHHYAIDRVADYEESQSVDVRVYAKDQATITNEMDESYTFVTIGTSPFLQGLAPYSGELEVDPARHVFMEIVDPETGVNDATIWIKINGLFAWQSGSAGAGFTVSKTPIADGFLFEITYPGGLLPTGSVVMEVYAANNAENPDILSTSYSFSTLDVFPPYLTDQDPAPGATGVETTRSVTFLISDDDQVVLSTVRVYIRDTLVFNGTSFTAGWTQSFYSAGGVNGYSFVVVPDSSEQWSEGETVAVAVLAEDPTGGQLSSTYEFTAGENLFPFSTYRFLIRSIREMDRKSPGLLQTLTEEGIDPIWKARVFDRLTELQSTIYDPTRIDAKWLPWLKTMVGFTRDLNFVATEEELRKIIKGAATYWDEKPTEFGLVQAIRLVTGNRFRIRDWFDLRWMVDEVTVTEQLEDFDPNVISSDEDFLTGTMARADTGAPTGYPGDHIVHFLDSGFSSFTSDDQYDWLVLYDNTDHPEVEGIHKIERCVEGDNYVILVDPLTAPRPWTSDASWRLAGGLGDWKTEIRLVDEPSGAGALNRDLVEFLLENVRNHGERIDVVYTAFLDEFLVPADTDQWDTSGANVSVPSPGGVLQIGPGEWAHTNTGFELDWYDQSTYFRCQGATGGLLHLKLWRIDADNLYWVRLDFTAGTVELWRRVAAVSAQLGSTVALPYIIAPDQVVGIRVDALTETPGVRVRVKVNGEVAIDEYGAPPTVVRGGIGAEAYTSTCKLSLVEVMALPVTVNRVGPNP